MSRFCVSAEHNGDADDGGREQASLTAATSDTPIRHSYQHPAARKNLLPAILPSPLTSVFTVVRGAPNLPTTRSTSYSHIKSKVFPQRPAERVHLAEAGGSSSKSPHRKARRSEASTNTVDIMSTQASRLRVERVRKQREEENSRRSERKTLKTLSTSEVRQHSRQSSLLDLRKIYEDQQMRVETTRASEEQTVVTETSQEVQKTFGKETTSRTYPNSPSRRSKSVPRRDTSTVPTTSGKTGRLDVPLRKSPEESPGKAEAKSTFPFLKKNEGRLSVPKPEDARKGKLSKATRRENASDAGRSSSPPRSTKMGLSPTETATPAAPKEATPRRPFSKARQATPKRSSALLPYWVPHDPSRVDVPEEDAAAASLRRSAVRDSLGEQAVRFKDWIKARHRGHHDRNGGRSAAVDATQALAREVILRDGDSSETDSGHEGDGILPDERVKDVVLEKVSRSLKQNVLPQDVVTMQLKPSPVMAVADDLEAITRTVRMSEFLDAAQRDIVVNCVQLKPDNVSDVEGSSPDVVSAASSSSSGSSSGDDGVLEFEIRHGREKNVFWLPTSKMRNNRKWQVTFIVAKTSSKQDG